MNCRNSCALLASTLFCLAITSSAMGQTQVDQDATLYRVSINGLMSITTSDANILHAHDQSDNDQDLQDTTWTVIANNGAGAIVEFETQSSFVHTVDSNIKVNASLSLAEASDPANIWDITTASAQTDHANSVELVKVIADSDSPGNAQFTLDVNFLHEGALFENLAAGDYEMTVQGTLFAK